MYELAEIKVSYNTKSAPKEKVITSFKAYEVLLKNWSLDTIELQEEFKILFLNNSNHVLGIYPMSKGGITGTVVDVRLLFAVALKCNATGVLLAHNHPSGKLIPSECDLSLTKKIKAASELLDIRLHDHIIVTKNGYYSMADNGEM